MRQRVCPLSVVAMFISSISGVNSTSMSNFANIHIICTYEYVPDVYNIYKTPVSPGPEEHIVPYFQ